jgi:hypothetical protein
MTKTSHIGSGLMKKNIAILLLSILLFLNLASQTSYASNTSACASVSHLITLKDVKKTFDTYEKISIVDKLKKLNEAQVEAWIEPIPHKYGYEGASSHRVVAILKATDKYCLLLLMRCEGAPYWEEMERSEWLTGQEDVTNQQYIVSVDKQGKYIDALPVAYSTSLSNSDIEFDANSKLYVWGRSVSSYFEGHRIRVVHQIFGHDAPDLESDDRNGWYEIIYSVNKDGKIIEVVPRKQIKDKNRR